MWDLLTEENGERSGFWAALKEGKQSGARPCASVSLFVPVEASQSDAAVRRGGYALCPLLTSSAPTAVQKRSRAVCTLSSPHAVAVMQVPTAPTPTPGPDSPKDSPRSSPGLFRKLLVNQSIRLQRRFTVAHPLW